ncbi:hypothetical protein TWF718_008834 [Orbilia javanica]|uniref:Ubiquitin-like protease family profile domain-containing protein n=1 Tax=Orbilia javanica TaxID=47235 RepID=A0AAN8MKL4_9PEZI
MIGALKTKIVDAISGVVQPLRDTFREPASMPFDGDKAFAEGMAAVSSPSVARQPEEKRTSSSSPPRQQRRGTETFPQGIHRSGNPKRAQKIVLGGVRPQNNLGAPRGSSAVATQPHGYAPPRKRPKPYLPRLLHHTLDRGNLRSSPPLDLAEDLDEQTTHDISNLTNGYGPQSQITREAPGHGLLSPLPFQSERQPSPETPLPSEPGDNVQAVRKGEASGDIMDLKYPKPTKKRPLENEDGARWNNASSSDPQRTAFRRRIKQAASSPIPVDLERVRQPESSEGKFFHIKTVWRGRVTHSISTALAMVMRVEDKGVSFVIGHERQQDFSSSYENIDFAAYSNDDEDGHKFRNFVYLKLRSRENGLPPAILLEFRGLPDPVKPGQKPYSTLFVEALKDEGVRTEGKAYLYMNKRMEETKQFQFGTPRTESSEAPWQNSARPIAPKSQLREVEGRPRTRANLIPLDEDDSLLKGQEQPGVERQVRRSYRNTPRKEVIEIPKPKPVQFPLQTWNQSLKFPFETQGPSELLDSSSLRTLNHDEFLNDEIINFHLGIVKARLAKENPEFARRVHIANTYLFPAFSTKTETGQFNYEKVRRWTKNANLFEKDLIFIPINEKYHWFVAVVCNLPAALAAARAREKKALMADELIAIEPTPKPKPAPKNRPVPTDQCTISILDSMVGYHTATLKAVKTYLVSEAHDKKGVTLDIDDFTGLLPRKLPGQDNFSDCGVFMLHYIERWLREPTRIKERLYERDFGSEEDARKLWSVSEVAKKRERMWRLYVKLNEEYEKCLKKEAFNEFPEIIDSPIVRSETPDSEGDTVVVTDKLISSPPKALKAQESVMASDAQRSNSPAKRKSDGRDGVDRPPKKAKSDSPVVVEEQPRVVAAPGLQHRATSPEIPSGGDVPCVLEVPETQDSEILRDLDALISSAQPLVAANGLVSPSADSPVQDTDSLSDGIEHMVGVSSPLVGGHPPIAVSLGAHGAVTAASFDYISINGSAGEVVSTRGDVANHTAPPRRTVEDIEDTEDESPGELVYNGGRSKGKSVHELENDRIIDTPSSQDHREVLKPPKEKELSTPSKGTAHDPIFIDSQSSPKRTSPRTKTTRVARP